MDEVGPASGGRRSSSPRTASAFPTRRWRPSRVGLTSRGSRRASRRADAGRPSCSTSSWTAAGAPGLPRSAPVLRIRRRRVARRGAARRPAHSGLGSERVQRGARPGALAFEDVAGRWLKELLGLPASASVGFVTGGQAANTVGLAAARWHVLHQHGWDVGLDGLTARHPSGWWRERSATGRSTGRCGCSGSESARWSRFPRRRRARWTPTRCAGARPRRWWADDRLRAGGQRQQRRLRRPAGVAEAAASVGAWVHVDGAFGLWAAASPRTRAARRRARARRLVGV